MKLGLIIVFLFSQALCLSEVVAESSTPFSMSPPKEKVVKKKPFWENWFKKAKRNKAFPEKNGENIEQELKSTPIKKLNLQANENFNEISTREKKTIESSHPLQHNLELEVIDVKPNHPDKMNSLEVLNNKASKPASHESLHAPKNPPLETLTYETQNNLEYLLKPGDRIEISVWGENMTRDLMVRPDGKISYILIDEVDVIGKSFKQLKKIIEDKLSKFIIEPKVSIIGKSFEGNYVSILGAVEKPGRVIVSNSDHILDVLAKAGGLKFIEFGSSGKVGEIANLRNAYLSRNGQLVPIDFTQLLYEGDMRFNAPVHIGDFIYIPSSIDMPIYVTGELYFPTSLPYSGKPTLLEAISVAQGFNTKASKSHIKVVRGGMVDPDILNFDYYEIVSGKTPNPRLEPGDIVYVPPTTLTKVERISTQIIPFLNSIIQTGSAKDTIKNW